MGLSLTINDLRVTSATGQVLLAVPELSLSAGACVGLRGPSGAGKSTLLFALAGLAENATGQVAWAKQLLPLNDPAACAAFRHKHIGMVFQEHLLFDELSPSENASISALFSKRADRSGIRNRSGAVLKQLGLASASTRSARTFSGGERQRIAVARALASDPEILLADEPTASLDRDRADQLAEDLTLAARQANKTLIVASHDPAFLDSMDHVIDIKDGLVA